LKERTTQIKSRWRKFKSPSDGKGLRNTPTHTVVNEIVPQASKKIVLKGNAKTALGRFNLPSAAKYRNNQSIVTNKFNSQSGISFKNQTDILYSTGDYTKLRYSSTNEHHDFMKTLTYKEQRAWSDFNEYRDFSKITLKPAMSLGFKLDTRGDRRIATEFARVISKIAEDNSGSLVEGNSIWDMNKILYRKLDNRNIIHCKGDKDKQSVILMLDSSPSCSKYVGFYSEMAVIAGVFNDVDMYDTPNGRLVHRWNAREREFERFLTVADICNKVHEWTLFNNRVILYFGDFDGIIMVLKNSYNNKIFYFGTEDEDYFKYTVRDYENADFNYNLNNLVYFPKILDRQTFINAMKTIR